MLYCSWDMVHDRCNYFSFSVIFCPFLPNSLKNQFFLKMEKTSGDIIILHKSTKNYDHMLYCSWDMVCNGCNYFSFWAIFCPFTPWQPRKSKFLKKWKKHLGISSFYMCVQKIIIRWCTVPEIWCATDRWTDKQTEIVTYRGGCPT